MNLFNYIKESKGEFKHISWPSKKQTIIYTILVVIVSVAVSLYLGLFDFIFTSIMDKFFI